MKRLLLLISFSILCLYSYAQTNVQQDNRVNPILKSALAARSGYYIYGRTSASGFINIAVLNDSSHTLCWFTCHGRLFDSTKLTAQEFEQVTSKQLDPFVLYQNICDKYLADIAAAKDIYRVYGDMQLFDKLSGNYRALFAMETVQAAKTRLQKLMAIENIRKKILAQLVYLNCVSPFGVHDNPPYKFSKEQAGAMIKSKDSTVYYNIDPTSAVAKISLYKKTVGQLYIQNRFSEIIDSVAIQPEKYDLLQKEKTDVFLLYRGWLEMRWQGTLSAIRRQCVGIYNQVRVQDEKAVKDLYGHLNAIDVKINILNSPEAKSIEQAVYDAYKNEASEINYMPLLGVAYSLTQTRGQKEYQLTNHLGNVLATVSDKKIAVSSSSNSSLIDHYEPDLVSAQDYYPFGMLQPGRSYLSPNGDRYRYGFNGKENDNEVKGEGNQQDYGMRVYDPRIGKFLSVDPLTKSYPFVSPFAFAENDVIRCVDLDGLEKYLVIYEPVGKTNAAKITITSVVNTESNLRENMKIVFNDNSPNDQSKEILRIRNGFRFTDRRKQDQYNSSLFYKGESFVTKNFIRTEKNDGKFSVTVKAEDEKGKDEVVGESVTFDPAKYKQVVSEGWGSGSNFRAGAFNILDGYAGFNYRNVIKAAGDEVLKHFQIIITTDDRMDEVVQKTYTEFLTKKYGKDTQIKWEVSDHDDTVSGKTGGRYNANVSVTATK